MDTENPGDRPPNKKLAELSDREFQIILEQASRPGFGACEIQRRFIEAIKAGNTAGSEALKAIRRSAMVLLEPCSRLLAIWHQYRLLKQRFCH
jgi:hypothetical protein